MANMIVDEVTQQYKGKPHKFAEKTTRQTLKA